MVRLLLWGAALPSPSLARKIARLMARLSRLSESYSVTRINLTTCFPDEDSQWVQRLTRQSLEHMYFMFFEIAQLRHWDYERLMAHVEVEGQALLDEALSHEKGLLLLVPHFGNWELMCAYLGRNYALAALYEPPKVASLQALIVESRERFDGVMYPLDTGGLRNVMRHLSDNGLVALLPDQVPARDAGVYADFFGQPALTMNLAHELIVRKQPAVLLGSVERRLHRGEEGYCLRFQTITLDEVLDNKSTARSINAAVEQVVLRAPEQYQWEYKRFKRPPTLGKTSIYRRQ